jgi:hypothetical protein
MAERWQQLNRKIRNNDDHAALAAGCALARKTGLTGKASVQTVIADFLANLLHLCGQCDPDGAVSGFNGLLNVAMMHYEQENGGTAKNRSDPARLCPGAYHRGNAKTLPFGKQGGQSASGAPAVPRHSVLLSLPAEH